jgi:hypothetical protein
MVKGITEINEENGKKISFSFPEIERIPTALV